MYIRDSGEDERKPGDRGEHEPALDHRRERSSELPDQPGLVEGTQRHAADEDDGRRVPHELAEAPPCLDGHLADHRPAEGEHLHDEGALLTRKQTVEAEPGRDADDEDHEVGEKGPLPAGERRNRADDPVSYTHLTLPTILRV